MQPAGFVANVGFIFIIPYVQLQLTGLGIIVTVASFEVISRTVAMVIAVALVSAFVFVNGIRCGNGAAPETLLTRSSGAVGKQWGSGAGSLVD